MRSIVFIAGIVVLIVGIVFILVPTITGAVTAAIPHAEGGELAPFGLGASLTLVGVLTSFAGIALPKNRQITQELFGGLQRFETPTAKSEEKQPFP